MRSLWYWNISSVKFCKHFCLIKIGFPNLQFCSSLLKFAICVFNEKREYKKMIPSNFLSHFSQNHHNSTIITTTTTTITKSRFSSVSPTWSSGASSSSANLLWGENREPLRRKGWHPNSWPGTHSRKSIKLIWPTKH